MTGDLTYELIRHPAIPLAMPDRLPDGGARTWAPLTTTLLLGREDAVLVDPPLTSAQAQSVIARLERSGRRLSAMLVTHGHGDHWFSAGMISKRLGGVPVLATAAGLTGTAAAASTKAAFWDRILPHQIPDPTDVAEIGPDGIELDGHVVRLADVGHSDTDGTAVVHVPDLGLVVAGDVLYDRVHPFLVESGDGGRDAWRAAIARVTELRPKQVVVGHSAGPSQRMDPDVLVADLLAYLDAVEDQLARRADPRSFFEAMVAEFPHWENRSTLWGSATALLG